jgi:hypothetical protein
MMIAAGLLGFALVPLAGLFLGHHRRGGGS